MNDRAFLSVFTPSRTAPEDLEAIFVQREAMLADAVERVRESAMTGNKHHQLFVGPRGTGKTHLVTLLVYRLSQDTTLQDRLHIAWLNEDETSTNLLEFLRRIYLALVKRHPGNYSEAALEPMYERDAVAATLWLENFLLQRLQNRTLLVVVENLDALFEGLGAAGQKQLRAFIQEHPVFAIVATAQRLVDDIAKRSSVFFGFFQTEPLETLSVEEAAELLGKIAKLNGQREAAAFLRSPLGRARIRALHHLSGGNHRIYLVLSQFITDDNIDALVIPFTKMIDEMTPYYQERIRWLPPQQRKIVEHLCLRERPAPVKDLAKRLFATSQSISSQLMDLRGKGYVLSAQRGRESLYEIAEPLMRLCVEVKENQTREPMRLLVDFLRVWYDEQVLSTRLQDYEDGSVARTYLQVAIEKNAAFGNLRAQLLVEDFRYELGEERGKNWLSRIQSYAKESEGLALACGEWAKGNWELALKILDEIAAERSGQSNVVRADACLLANEIYNEQGAFESVIESAQVILSMVDVNVDQTARVLNHRGVAYAGLGEQQKAITDFTAVINVPGASTDLVALAFNNLGVTYEQLGDQQKAMTEYSYVIELPDAPAKRLEVSLNNRGWSYLRLGNREKAIDDFSKVIKLRGASPDHVSVARLNRGWTYEELGDKEKAIADYSAIIAMKDISEEQIATALNQRGWIYGQNGDQEKAKADYSAVIAMPNLTAEKTADALLNRGQIYEWSGEEDKSLADYNAIVELSDAPTAQIANALNRQGVIYGIRGNYAKAISDFSTVIAMPDALADQVVDALYKRGLVYGHSGDNEMAKADFSAVIKFPNASYGQIAEALYNRGVAYRLLGDHEKEIADYNAILALQKATSWAIENGLYNRGCAYRQIGEREKAIADYGTVIGMIDANVENVAKSLTNRGGIYEDIGDLEKAIADYSAVLDLKNASVESFAFALFNRGLIYIRKSNLTHAEQDFESILGLAGVPIEKSVDAQLALAEIRIATGRWEAALATLAEGLTQGTPAASHYLGDSEDIVAAFFTSSLAPNIRCERAGELLRVYAAHDALTALGEALIRHLGAIYRAAEGLPATDNLELWATAWEDAGQDNEAFRLPLRLFRTGIDFLKAGGKDRGILLDLNQEERKILEQSLGLD